MSRSLPLYSYPMNHIIMTKQGEPARNIVIINIPFPPDKKLLEEIKNCESLSGKVSVVCKTNFNPTSKTLYSYSKKEPGFYIISGDVEQKLN